jgi:hypothetical protein
MKIRLGYFHVSIKSAEDPQNRDEVCAACHMRRQSMPLDREGYRDFNITAGLGNVRTPHVMEVRVDPGLNNNADVLCFYSGVIELSESVVGTSSNWRRGSLIVHFPTGNRKWFRGGVQGGPGWTLFLDGTAILLLASIMNDNVANNAGWAVDAAIVEPTTLIPQVGGEDYLSLQALLAVRDSDGHIQRLAYQVTALGRTLV